MPDTGAAENEEARRPRFTGAALLDLLDLLRHFQTKVEPSSGPTGTTANEGDSAEAPSDGQPRADSAPDGEAIAHNPGEMPGPAS
jgi:hypothetical protein